MIRVWIPSPGPDDKKTIDIALAELGIEPDKKMEILSRRRQRNIVDDRQRVAKFLYERGFSYPEIGKMMNRDHTSIMHLVKNRKG
jgi:chromosomal replication initiation ATPase DnaA